jgi:hypothetical protein
MSMPSMKARDAGRCTFQPKNGGSWQRCYDLAQWASPESTQPGYSYRERRCDKHLATDQRTAANARAKHGWATDRADRMVAFDAPAAIRAAEAREVAEARARSDARWALIDAAVAKRDINALREAVR